MPKRSSLPTLSLMVRVHASIVREISRPPALFLSEGVRHAAADESRADLLAVMSRLVHHSPTGIEPVVLEASAAALAPPRAADLTSVDPLRLQLSGGSEQEAVISHEADGTEMRAALSPHTCVARCPSCTRSP